MSGTRTAGPVAIIGAGHNGLVCAIRLAQAGVEVIVLEQGPQPGGGVRSAETTLPGFIHDLHAAFMPMARVSPALRRLPLERHGLEWISPPVAMAHPFADGDGIALHRDPHATAADLERHAPGAGRAWTELVERLLPLQDAIADAAFGRFPPVRAAARLAFATRLEGLRLAGMMAGPAASAGLRLFGRPRPAAWLSGSVGHSDLSPRDLGSGGLALGLAILGHAVGWPYPRGGAQRLTQALCDLLRELGGTIRCDARVTRIDVKLERVRGVTLTGGERIGAAAVVATVGPAPLLAMLPAGALGGRVERRLRRWRYGLGTVKLDLALAAPAPWSNGAAREAAVVHVGGELEELIEAPREAWRGITAREPVVIVGQHSVHDPSRAPAGRHTLYAYARVPPRPREQPRELAELIERRIERFAPGLGELVLGRHVRMPGEIEADNPALVNGDIAAGSLRLRQQLIFRPAPELIRNHTPLHGLYVAGAGLYPLPGVHGASGDSAARAVLSDRQRHRGELAGRIRGARLGPRSATPTD